MEKKQMLKQIIERKKQVNKTPRYGIRKLSIGVVSCMLGFCLFFSPSSAMAMESLEEAGNTVSIEQVAETQELAPDQEVQAIGMEEEGLKMVALLTENEKEITFPETSAGKVEDEQEAALTEAGEEKEEDGAKWVFEDAEIVVMEQGKKVEEKSDTLEERQQKEKVVKTRWVEGVKADTKDFKNIKEVNVRHTKHDTYDYYVLEQGMGSGYYDVDKKLDGKDELYCSVATAANMFHWWMGQNKDNIDKYRKESDKHGVLTVGGVTKDVKDLNEYSDGESPFFDFVKKHYTVKSTWPQVLLNTHINGRKNKDTQKRSFTFFPEVFTKDSFFEIKGTGNKDMFSRNIKDALDGKKALAITYYTGTKTNHIVNIWGADFDDQDKVVAIYVSDSDDGTVKLNNNKKIGLTRYTVGEKDGEVILPQNPSANNGAKTIQLFTFSSAQKEWEEYFKRSEQKKIEAQDGKVEEQLPSDDPSVAIAEEKEEKPSTEQTAQKDVQPEKEQASKNTEEKVTVEEKVTEDKEETAEEEKMEDEEKAENTEGREEATEEEKPEEEVEEETQKNPEEKVEKEEEKAQEDDINQLNQKLHQLFMDAGEDIVASNGLLPEEKEKLAKAADPSILSQNGNTETIKKNIDQLKKARDEFKDKIEKFKKRKGEVKSEIEKLSEIPKVDQEKAQKEIDEAKDQKSVEETLKKIKGENEKKLSIVKEKALTEINQVPDKIKNASGMAPEEEKELQTVQAEVLQKLTINPSDHESLLKELKEKQEAFNKAVEKYRKEQQDKIDKFTELTKTSQNLAKKDIKAATSKDEIETILSKAEIMNRLKEENKKQDTQKDMDSSEEKTPATPDQEGAGQKPEIEIDKQDDESQKDQEIEDSQESSKEENLSKEELEARLANAQKSKAEKEKDLEELEEKLAKAKRLEINTKNLIDELEGRIEHWGLAEAEGKIFREKDIDEIRKIETGKLIKLRETMEIHIADIKDSQEKLADAKKNLLKYKESPKREEIKDSIDFLTSWIIDGKVIVQLIEKDINDNLNLLRVLDTEGTEAFVREYIKKSQEDIDQMKKTVKIKKQILEDAQKDIEDYRKQIEVINNKIGDIEKNISNYSKKLEGWANKKEGTPNNPEVKKDQNPEESSNEGKDIIVQSPEEDKKPNEGKEASKEEKPSEGKKEDNKKEEAKKEQSDSPEKSPKVEDKRGYKPKVIDQRQVIQWQKIEKNLIEKNKNTPTEQFILQQKLFNLSIEMGTKLVEISDKLSKEDNEKFRQLLLNALTVAQSQADARELKDKIQELEKEKADLTAKVQNTEKVDTSKQEDTRQEQKQNNKADKKKKPEKKKAKSNRKKKQKQYAKRQQKKRTKKNKRRK